MIHNSTKVIAILSISFFLVCVALVVYFGYRISEHRALYEARAEEAFEAERRSESIRELGQKLAETKTERESLTHRILEEDDFIDFLELIQTIGQEQSAVIATSDFTEEPINAMFNTLIMHIDVRGSYDSVMHVLKIFEYLPYQAEMSALQVLREEGDAGPTWKATFTLRVTKYIKI